MLVRAFILTAAACTLIAQDATEIVKKSLDKEIRNQRRLSNYSWQTKSVFHEKDKAGKHKKTESKVHDQLNIDGTTYRKLVEEDGKPLSADKARKEQERMDKEIAKRRNESEKDRQKRQRDHQKEIDEAIKFREEVGRAFDFKLVGEEKVNGFDCWRVSGEPKPGFKPTTSQGKWLPKVHGTLWIEKQSYEWLRMNVELLDNIRFLGFVASLGKGTRMEAQQMRVNNELWHPQWARFNGNVRALWKSMRGDAETQWQNFRKFQTESKVIATEEVPVAAGTKD